jgi:hypothetical protein
VIIPCNSGGITGSVNGPLLIDATTVAEAVYNSSDSKLVEGIYSLTTPATQIVRMFFNTTAYANLLTGKRILGVNLLYTADSDFSPSMDVLVQGDNLFDYYSLQNIVFQPIGGVTEIKRMRLGEVTPFWDPAVLATAQGEALPWRYQDLARFEASASNRISVVLATGGAQTGGFLWRVMYSALEVVYCEEQRVVVGGASSISQGTTYGANTIRQRTVGTYALNPVLPAGTYDLTISSGDTGDDSAGSYGSSFPLLNALREQYQVPSMPGIRVDIPSPPHDHVGDTFAAIESHVLPQLSLHASGGVLTELHVYGRQAVAQVYGGRTAVQKIFTDQVPSDLMFPNVRFIARRFGNTTVPLTLSGLAPAAGLSLPGTAGDQASTPDDAALDILGDIDIRVDATLSNSVWFASSGTALLAKYNATGNQRAYRLYIENGLLRFGWSPDGATVNANSPDAAHVPAAGGRLAVRVTMDIDDGGGNRVIVFYTAPTITGPWTQLGSTITTAGVTSIAATTADMFVGADGTGATSMLAGVVHAAEVYDGIAGLAVANPDFSAQPVGTTSFVDAAGRTWTVNGNAHIIVGITSSNASITPTEFDALDEILSGWKTVDLRFAGPPIMGQSSAIQLAWEWSATGENAGNRWEILGASAPALTGSTGSLLTLVTPAGQQLYEATYEPPNGSLDELSWAPGGVGSAYVASTTEDDSSDAVIMFAQDMPTVTGFSVSIQSQALTGIGQECGIDPCGIPTHILYPRLAWGLPPNTGVAADYFNRIVANGWGSADPTGGAYSLTGNASQYSVDSGVAYSTPDGTSSDRFMTLNTGSVDFDIKALIGISTVVSDSNSRQTGVVGRMTNGNNRYAALLLTSSSSTSSTLIISKRVGGSPTTIAGPISVPFFLSSGAQVYLRFTGKGTQLKAKAWVPTQSEPPGWAVEATDSSLTTGNLAGFFARTDALSTTFTYAQLEVTPPSYWFGYYELQRSDNITEWQTIMKATNPAVSGFSDYEARIGTTSDYRIRGVDVYGFYGPWSSTVSISILSPGVSGSCLDQAHIMTFTTNEHQSGYSNLAYSNAWEDTVSEDFGFAEAGFTQLQPMYNRDFFTAFRPTERGGEQFTRSVLVQAAAIAPETLGDFQSLRDMAWTQVSYICVRDEDGNRWFASVSVPNGVVRNRRRLYMATVQIVEVTDTPSPVDP